MNITFLIGNGFDINLGLKTKYEDFYPYYLSKGHNDMISKSIAGHYEKWADLELALGELLAEVSAEQINDFLDAKEALEGDLAEYLLRESSTLMLDPLATGKVFRDQLCGFCQDFSTRYKSEFELWKTTVKEKITYQLISFNYTATLDRIVEKGNILSPFSVRNWPGYRYEDKLGNVLHVHGTLEDGGGLILGLDHVGQIKNSKLAAVPELTDYIIKETVNESLGEQRVAQAKKLIDDSCYVAVFGLSLGETDLMWWKYLYEWLEKSPLHRLVLYIYGEKPTNPSAQAQLRQANKYRDVFFNQIGVTKVAADRIRSRIIVVVGSSIFDFKEVLLEKETAEPAE